jgi:hypothetical protein
MIDLLTTRGGVATREPNGIELPVWTTLETAEKFQQS